MFAAMNSAEIDRLLKRVEFEPNTGCWLWSGYCMPYGYGQIGRPDNGGPERTHRYSYELHFGAIPPGLFVCHRCDTPACCNPTHLFLGTAKDNTQDMDRKGRGRRVRLDGTHPRQKISDEVVRHIRRREMSAVRYAKLYGLGRCYVHQIQSGDFRQKVA